MSRDYNAAIKALNTLQSNHAIVDAIRKSGRGMNQNAIPEMIEWCRRIGYEPVQFNKLNAIHIAGTKGKGSTSAFVSSILVQHAKAQNRVSKIGLYTSPHLRSVRERIQINNVPLTEDVFARYFYEIWDRLEASAEKEGHANPSSPETKPVYFRFLTLMAFHCYMEEGVDTAVVECGIGGEYDSTNIIVKPSVTAVTSLGIDHTAMLGDTIESIAWHKGGIFKPGVPAFTVPQSASALQVLEQRASNVQTELKVAVPLRSMQDVKLGLAGDFQQINASLAVAVAAAHVSRQAQSESLDLEIDQHHLPDAFRAGLEQVKFGGRCETRKDTSSNLTWYIDGGHTLESIDVAGRWFASLIKPEEADTPVSSQAQSRILIFNQQTRDANLLARRLFETLSGAIVGSDRSRNKPFTHAIFCTNTTYASGGYRFKPDLTSINTNADDVAALSVQNALAQTWRDIDPAADVHVVMTIEEAVLLARKIAGTRTAEMTKAEDGVVEEVKVLVTGSLHLVGGLIEVLESEAEASTVDADGKS